MDLMIVKTKFLRKNDMRVIHAMKRGTVSEPPIFYCGFKIANNSILRRIFTHLKIKKTANDNLHKTEIEL